VGNPSCSLANFGDNTGLSSQRSHFTVFGTHVDGLAELRERNDSVLGKIIIPAGSVPKIKSELELAGISEITIFPDLEALSRELTAVWKSRFGASEKQ